MKKRWIAPEPVEVPPELVALMDGQRIAAEILVRRGITTLSAARTFLEPELYQPASPFDLPNMEKAVSRIIQAIEKQENVGIWGDFDVDGQTATTLLITALGQMGLQPQYYIPSRETEGHGISKAGVKTFTERHNLTLIITCDTGIAEHEAIAFAQDHGVDVIVTDHHKLPGTLPQAYACVNPQMLPASHPLFTLPGVGCAYKLVEALAMRHTSNVRLDELLDLVALGIVADVAILTGDTRYLLQRGLRTLRQSRRPGTQALYEVAKLDQTKIDEQDIGFSLGPRLNAVGRLGDARDSVELLSTDDLARARILANRMEGLNDKRRLETELVFKAAVAQIGQNPSLLDYNVLVLSHPEWQRGVLGIVANRLVEQYQRPVVLISSSKDEIARGSARSIAGCDITAAIASVASYSQYIQEFGGHTMAAGISLLPQNIADFRRELSRAVGQLTATVDATLLIDGYIHLAEVTPSLVQQLKRLAPYGPGNPTPILASRGVEVIHQRTLGRDGDHLRFTIADERGSDEDGTEIRDVVWWRWPGDALPEGRFDLAFTVRESTYKGVTELLIEYVDLQRYEEDFAENTHKQLEIVDLRLCETSFEALSALVKEHEGSMCIWNEGEALDGIITHTRQTLSRAETLVVWTSPPDPQTLQEAVGRVKPRQVYLFAVEPNGRELKDFLLQVGQGVKYRLSQREGEIVLAELAERTGQTVKTVRKALEWLTARGDIVIIEDRGDMLRVERGKNPVSKNNAEQLQQQISALLEETKAYRRYYKTADKIRLFSPE